MIIFRYLTKEIISALVAITLILVFIFLSHQLIRYLDIAAQGKIASFALFKLILLEIPHLLGMLLPLGLFLAILFSYGRLYVDNEMTVLFACGLSRWRLVALTLPVALGVMFLVAMQTFWWGPKICEYRNRLLAQINSEPTMQTIIPGRFHEISGGKRIVYVEKVSTDHQHINNVFVAEQDKEKDDSWRVLSAKRGYQAQDKNTGNRFLVTTDGRRYMGKPGLNEYQILRYEKYGVRLQAPLPGSVGDEDALPSVLLLKAMHKKVELAAELQWRIAIPLQALVLAVLAVPLSRVKPRQGKFARFLPSILIYIVYANLMMLSKGWIAHGTLSFQWGVVLGHALILMLGLFLLVEDMQWKKFKLR